MKPFEYYLNGTDVKKITPDEELAKSLIKDMHERIDKISKLDIKIFSKIIFENMYDALRDFCDAVLAIDGYKSYSHKASIAYLVKYLGLEDYGAVIRENIFYYTENKRKIDSSSNPDVFINAMGFECDHSDDDE